MRLVLVLSVALAAVTAGASREALAAPPIRVVAAQDMSIPELPGSRFSGSDTSTASVGAGSAIGFVFDLDGEDAVWFDAGDRYQLVAGPADVMPPSLLDFVPTIDRSARGATVMTQNHQFVLWATSGGQTGLWLLDPFGESPDVAPIALLGEEHPPVAAITHIGGDQGALDSIPFRVNRLGMVLFEAEHGVDDTGRPIEALWLYREGSLQLIAMTNELVEDASGTLVRIGRAELTEAGVAYDGEFEVLDADGGVRTLTGVWSFQWDGAFGPEHATIALARHDPDLGATGQVNLSDLDDAGRVSLLARGPCTVPTVDESNWKPSYHLGSLTTPPALVELATLSGREVSSIERVELGNDGSLLLSLFVYDADKAFAEPALGYQGPAQSPSILAVARGDAPGGSRFDGTAVGLFDNAVLNHRGRVAFTAPLEDGRSAVFWHDAGYRLERVVSTGEALTDGDGLARTLAAVGLPAALSSPRPFGDDGVLCFAARFDDLKPGIACAGLEPRQATAPRLELALEYRTAAAQLDVRLDSRALVRPSHDLELDLRILADGQVFPTWSGRMEFTRPLDVVSATVAELADSSLACTIERDAAGLATAVVCGEEDLLAAPLDATGRTIHVTLTLHPGDVVSGLLDLRLSASGEAEDGRAVTVGPETHEVMVEIADLAVSRIADTSGDFVFELENRGPASASEILVVMSDGAPTDGLVECERHNPMDTAWTEQHVCLLPTLAPGARHRLTYPASGDFHNVELYVALVPGRPTTRDPDPSNNEFLRPADDPFKADPRPSSGGCQVHLAAAAPGGPWSSAAALLLLMLLGARRRASGRALARVPPPVQRDGL